MSAFEICGMCGRQYDTAAAAHSCDHKPAKPREWWFDEYDDHKPIAIGARPIPHGAVHVIEKSAYDAILAEKNECIRVHDDTIKTCKALQKLCTEIEPEMAKLTARAEKAEAELAIKKPSIAEWEMNRRGIEVTENALHESQRKVSRLEAEVGSLHQAAAHNGKGAYDKINSLEAKIESLKGIAKIMDIAKATIGIDPAQVAAEINENKQLKVELEKERAVNKVLVEALEELADYNPTNSNVEFMAYVAQEALTKAEELRK
jgi:hypothetical protein